MEFITELLKKVNEFVWGMPLICLLLGTEFILHIN